MGTMETGVPAAYNCMVLHRSFEVLLRILMQYTHFTTGFWL